MTTILHLIRVAGQQFDALRWEQQVGILALILAATAAVFYCLMLREALHLRQQAHALSRRLTALQELMPPRECETYCRSCNTYKVTTETACEVCGTPLRLFSDAIDMSAHMARTFPLPPVTKDAAIYVPQRHRRVQ